MKDVAFRSLLKKIIKEKTHCFFFSPHFDDAALSAGGLISYLADKVPVTVVNVFTKADKGPPTISAKAFLTQSSAEDAEKLFFEREKEDNQILRKVGVKVINLGFIDVMWRKKDKLHPALLLLGRLIPEFIHAYPTYRFHAWTGRVSSQDNKLKAKLKKKLRGLVSGRKNYLIFCPVGIGHYVDHIIVRDICTNAFDHVIYWSDFNYSMEFTTETKFIKKKNLQLAYFDKEPVSKRKMIESYKNQMKAIFPHGKIPMVPDFYYL